MRIQHNIMALNAYRQLGGNNSALAKNLEKLSSGYAINRAGDDAAGLAISEKMRAQIKGLEAAQKNANDGISLVQTAEGALTEVHSMLNRMVYLATQSANGTYDNEVDRANLDKEVQTLKEEIDRISQSTNFNGLKLLDGSMDADATKTTGGKTDVPILQNVATNPTQEVGTATVLHKDNPEPKETEINVELHNVAITSKSQEGDIIKFQVGDNEIELELQAKAGDADVGDPDNGVLVAGTQYTSEQIAKAIAAKFNQTGNNLIGGQEFIATANKNGINFKQDGIPDDPTQVVNANVDVKIDYVTNPTGNPVEYTAKIKPDALATGNKITIGGDQMTLGDPDGPLKDTTSLQDGAFFDGFETASGYKVKYENGTLKVTDPNGTLGAPALKYDGYGTFAKMSSDEVKGVDEVKASVTQTFAGMGLAADYELKDGDKFEFDGETFTYDLANEAWTGGTNYTVTNTAGGLKIEAVADGTTGNTPEAAPIDKATIKFTIAPDTAGTVTFNGGTAGVKAKAEYDVATPGADTPNVTLGAGYTANYTQATDTWSTPTNAAATGETAAMVKDGTTWKLVLTKDDPGTAGNTGDFDGGEDATVATGTFTLESDPGAGDSITINDGANDIVFTRDADGNWSDGGDANNTSKIAVSGEGKDLTITRGDATTDCTAFNGDANKLNVTDITYVARNAAANASLTGGVDAAGAKREFDLDNANLADGDKIKLTLSDGSTKDIVFETDLETSLNNAGIVVAANGTVADLAVAPAGGGAATEKVTVVGNKLTIQDLTQENSTSVVPKFEIRTSKKEDNTVTMDTPANADSITGTWNVQSTKNIQGAAIGGGQLASTTFDLTADMVKDGNTLTIGKETYIFKIGADSTTKAAPGQTVIDLSKYKADDPNLVDLAGAELANQTTNKAFTIGYADNGKISIHEREGQTQYTNGELESVEEFDKLVYMNSPEVTENTGKGLTFQVGDTADDYQKVSLSIHDMSSEGLGIADVNIATIDDAASAIDKIKAAINTVSSQRGDLGAIQNRLEHTINNLGVQTENITAAESRIRDTDMAQEMMAYTKNNILVQAAQAMLAQANQVPQGVLQLLQ